MGGLRSNGALMHDAQHVWFMNNFCRAMKLNPINKECVCVCACVCVCVCVWWEGVY